MGRFGVLVLAATLGWSAVSAAKEVRSAPTTTTTVATSPTTTVATSPTTSTGTQNQYDAGHITNLIAHTESTQAGLDTNPTPTTTPTPTPSPTTSPTETPVPTQNHPVSTNTPNETPSNATPTPTSPTSSEHHGPHALTPHTESSQPNLDEPTKTKSPPTKTPPATLSAHTESTQPGLDKPTKSRSTGTPLTRIAHTESTQPTLDGYSTSKKHGSTPIYASPVTQSSAASIEKPSAVLGQHGGSTLDVPSGHQTASSGGGHTGSSGQSVGGSSGHSAGDGNGNSGGNDGGHNAGTGSSPTQSPQDFGGLIASAIDLHGSQNGGSPVVTPAPKPDTWLIHGTPVSAGGRAKTIDGTTYSIPKSGGDIMVNGTPTKLPHAVPTGKDHWASGSNHSQGTLTRSRKGAAGQTTKKISSHHTSTTSPSLSSKSPTSTSTHKAPALQASSSGAGRWLPSFAFGSLCLVLALV